VKGEHRKTRRTMAGNRVLMLGKLRELALYRAEVLRDRGFDVKIPATSAEAVAEITRGEFDVAVLSYTLSSDEVQSLAELVRQSCPDCPLVTISTTGMPDLKVNPDETVLADEGPSGLIKVLLRLRRHH
jgi:CheY-like chemotaxis protein